MALDSSLTSISVTTLPTKVKYKLNETLDLTGLVVKANYSDGSSVVITTYTTNPINGAVLTKTNNSVTVTYTEDGFTYSTNFAIEVIPVEIVSWSTGTDAQILAMVNALDAGKITVADTEWQVGDSRDVSLSAFQTYSDSTSSTTSQSAQTAQLVIMNIGGETFRGNDNSLDGQSCHFVVGFKDNVCKSCWGVSSNVYATSLIKTVENNIYNALPSTIKPIFKKFDVVTGTYSGKSTSGGTNVTSQQYFASPAEKEIFGSITKSTSNEANALSQFTYYTTANNRKHTNIVSSWWERSPDYFSEKGACYVYLDGTAGAHNIDQNVWGVAPFGCI